MILTRLDRLIG